VLEIQLQTPSLRLVMHLLDTESYNKLFTKAWFFVFSIFVNM